MNIKPDLTAGRATRVTANVPDGMQAIVLAREIEARLKAAPTAPVSLVFVARDGRRLDRMADILAQLLPGHPIPTLPAWGLSSPYDRVRRPTASPSPSA